MTSEERAFQDALDLDRDDTVARLAFADYLDEHDDPRGIGHRVIVARGWGPCAAGSEPFWTVDETLSGPGYLPPDVYAVLEIRGKGLRWAPTYSNRTDKATRREVEDAIGPAVMKLPEARRAELLAPALAEAHS